MFDPYVHDGHAQADCPACQGTGEEQEWVPYGEGFTPMPVACGCWCHDDEDKDEPSAAIPVRRPPLEWWQ